MSNIGLRHLLTTNEVSEKLGVSRHTVAHWCREGFIFPAISYHGYWLIEPGFQLVAVKPIGRPPGARNRKPYPRGVKRPRKTPPTPDVVS